MQNFVCLIGRLQSFKKTDDNKCCMIIKLTNIDGDFSTPVYTNFDYNNSFINQLEEDALIAIKGFISLDIDANVIIVANKLSFLSSNKKGVDM